MKKKRTAIIITVIMLAAAMPQSVRAASGTLSADDVRLLRAVTTDQNGKTVYEEYYNEQEMIERMEVYGDSPEESYQTISLYDESGIYLQQEISVWYDGTQQVLMYLYNEDHLLTSIESAPSPDGDLQWKESYTYDQRGNVIYSKYESAEGQVYTEETEYDDAGRIIAILYTEKENPYAEADTWRSEKTYDDIDELSWSVRTVIYDQQGDPVADYTESRVYDDRGNLITSVEQKEGSLYRTTNTYNSQNQLIQTVTVMEEEPDFGAYTGIYSYRPDGHLKEINFGYDSVRYTTAYYYTLKPFVDVEDTEYFAIPVKWAVDQGITSGVTAVAFAPYEMCTRAQAVTFLWRAAGMPEPANSVQPFVDVHDYDYYYKAVLWAVENGITNGLSADYFGSDDTCSRGQIVTFLHRFMGEPGIGGTVTFADVNEGDYFYGAVLWAVADGVTKGTSDTTFDPATICTRGQIVTFLYRALGTV